ncbi:MAG: hypothetical protein Q7S34_03840 [bacterium]|nr:hypothetical protein [bacterium]
MPKKSTFWFWLGVIIYLITITPTFVDSLIPVTNAVMFPFAILVLPGLAVYCICLAALKWCEENQ